MHRNLSFIGDLPLAFWVILLAGVAFVGEYVLLRVRQRRFARPAAEAERRLIRFATALRHYARDNLQRLPPTLDELGLPEAEAIVYHPVPRLNADERLILVHDREPTHRVLEFPALRNGRGVILCSGRLMVVSEEVFEKLSAADHALRVRLGLADDGRPPPAEDSEHGQR